MLVAHDLDLAGPRIFGTLGGDTSRYTYTHELDIRRTGPTLAQVQARGLEPEDQEITGGRGCHWNSLSGYGIPETEIDFILDGNRVELNAMPADTCVRWLEDAQAAHGVRKVVASAAVLQGRARRIVAAQAIAPSVKALEERARKAAARRHLPGDLAERVAAELVADPAVPSEDALERALAADWAGRRGGSIRDFRTSSRSPSRARAVPPGR